MEGLQVTLGYLGKLPRSMNSGLTFLLVLRGGIEVDRGANKASLGKNDILVVNHREVYGVTGRRANVVLMVNLSRDFVEQHCPEVARYSYQCCSAGIGSELEGHYAEIKNSLARVSFLYYKKEPGHELLIQSALYSALYTLLMDFRGGAEGAAGGAAGEGEGAPGPDERLQGILNYIHQNFKNRVTLEEIAAGEYMSVQYVSKLFRQKMGVTFMDYLAGLRLDSAVSDLLYTRDSVTKIAMQNGFANAKSFNNQFRRVYGTSPSEYRRAHQEEDESAGTDVHLLKVDSEDSLEALVRFIDTYDQAAETTAQVEHTIDVSIAPERPLAGTTAIINIGDLRQMLRADTRAQLEIVSKNLKVDYVYFNGFLQMNNVGTGERALLFRYDFFEAFDLFREMGIAPFIRIDLKDLHDEAMFPGPEGGFQALRQLLTGMRQRFTPLYLDRWRIELVGSPEEMRRDFAKICEIVEERSTELRVGMQVQVDAEHEEEVLYLLGQRDIASHIGFLSFKLDPNDEAAPRDAVAYEQFHRTYHRSKAKKIRGWTRQVGMEDLPLYLVDWNTLTGRTVVEAGEFHRTALLADALFSMSEEMEGVGIRMSLISGERMTPGLITHPISLFIYRNIRRPMFFVHRAFTELKGMVLYQRDNIILTTDGWDRYALLIYNPCYINPFHSLDNLRRISGAKTMQVSLEGLRPGKYRVKAFLMDKDNGSLYHSWVKINLSVPLDAEDIDEYMETASNPAVAMFEAEVDGSYTISQEMSLNATALFILKRYDDGEGLPLQSV